MRGILSAIGRLRHQIAHWTSWNLCVTHSWTAENGHFMTGGKCVTCGRVNPKTVVDWEEVARKKGLKTS